MGGCQGVASRPGKPEFQDPYGLRRRGPKTTAREGAALDAARSSTPGTPGREPFQPPPGGWEATLPNSSGGGGSTAGSELPPPPSARPIAGASIHLQGDALRGGNSGLDMCIFPYQEGIFVTEPRYSAALAEILMRRKDLHYPDPDLRSSRPR